MKAVAKLAQRKASDAGRAAKASNQQHAADLGSAVISIATLYDILMHIEPELEEGSLGQSWCGANAAQAQKGALSSKERRKRKRKEVRLWPYTFLFHEIHICVLSQSMAYLHPLNLCLGTLWQRAQYLA